MGHGPWPTGIVGAAGSVEQAEKRCAVDADQTGPQEHLLRAVRIAVEPMHKARCRCSNTNPPKTTRLNSLQQLLDSDPTESEKFRCAIPEKGLRGIDEEGAPWCLHVQPDKIHPHPKKALNNIPNSDSFLSVLEAEDPVCDFL